MYISILEIHGGVIVLPQLRPQDNNYVSSHKLEPVSHDQVGRSFQEDTV